MINQNELTNYLEQHSMINQQPGNQANKNLLNQPYLRIVEQPASLEHRFRYKCESRLAGSIPGCNSTNERRTYPTIEIVNYRGRAIVTVSCVTIQPPYRPHPHQLVGKGHCSKGICRVELNSDQMRYQFESLGIQCVRKRDIAESLRLREASKIDPFKTGFAHSEESSCIDLNAVRLCFEALIEDKEKQNYGIRLQPVVSDIIYDKKTMGNLGIHKLSPCHASVSSEEEMILVCNCVAKNNIQVRFYEKHNDQIVWEKMAHFLPGDVYRRTVITFKIPKYRLEHINQAVECFVQLRRKTDGELSLPEPFYYLPDPLYQPIKSVLRNRLPAFRNYAADTANLNNNNYSNNAVPRNTARNLITSGLNSNTLMQANLSQNFANCLTTNLSNFPTNLVNNLSIQSLQQHQVHLQNSPHQLHNNLQASPISAKKRCKIESEQDQAYDLAVSTAAKVCRNKNLISSTVCSIDKQSPSESQMIINNFHSTINSAASKNFETLQMNFNNSNPKNTFNNYSIGSISNNIISNPVSNTFSSSNNAVIPIHQDQQGQNYFNFRNQLYQVQQMKGSNQKVDTNNNEFQHNNMVENGFVLNANNSKN